VQTKHTVIAMAITSQAQRAGVPSTMALPRSCNGFIVVRDTTKVGEAALDFRSPRHPPLHRNSIPVTSNCHRNFRRISLSPQVACRLRLMGSRAVITLCSSRCPIIVLVTIPTSAQPTVSNPERQFEAAVVKHYDHRNDRGSLIGPVALFGCYIGPGRLQYSCNGSVTKLMAEALNLSNFQFEKTPAPPEYVMRFR
jgi:hypothetical protein